MAAPREGRRSDANRLTAGLALGAGLAAALDAMAHTLGLRDPTAAAVFWIFILGTILSFFVTLFIPWAIPLRFAAAVGVVVGNVAGFFGWLSISGTYGKPEWHRDAINAAIASTPLVVCLAIGAYAYFARRRAGL